MNSLAFFTLAIVLAYLIGSIPFGLLVARWVKGIDIRTVGSGNIGATNVGRVLGFRYFALVMLLDLMKGLIPTMAFPRAVTAVTSAASPDLPVLTGLAAILGHTFPVYLGFRGGKGVATSLGVVLALDPFSSLVAAVVFGLAVAFIRYVSLASIIGGAGFVVSYFLRLTRRGDASVNLYFDREHVAMSLFVIAVMMLLIIRHRSNLSRIWNGTESRVKWRGERSRPGGSAPPAGKALVSGMLVAGVVLLVFGVAGVWVYERSNERSEVIAGPWLLREIERRNTGEQRIDRVAFSADGDFLVATCPRYNRVLIHRVGMDRKLDAPRVVELKGRPMAALALANAFVILNRPPGDNKHLEPGWVECFDWSGNRIGSRLPTGFYPDDLALSPDGRFLYVLTSGRAEGDLKKPLPSIQVVNAEGATGGSPWQVVGCVELEPNDDPERLTISATGQCVGVLLGKTKRIAAIDLADPVKPLLVGMTAATNATAPYVSHAPFSDWILMPAATGSEAIALQLPSSVGPGTGQAPQPHDIQPTPRRADYLICTDQHFSVVEVVQESPRQSLGKLPLRGPFNLGWTKPTALAYCQRRNLLAVSTRAGAIHLVEVLPRIVPDPPLPSSITRATDPTMR